MVELAVGISAVWALGDVVSRIAPRSLVHVVMVRESRKDNNRLPISLSTVKIFPVLMPDAHIEDLHNNVRGDHRTTTTTITLT